MGAEVERLRRALNGGVMTGIILGHGALTAKLEKNHKGLEVIDHGESISSDPQVYGNGGPWS
jgi:hypothetical protein